MASQGGAVGKPKGGERGLARSRVGLVAGWCGLPVTLIVVWVCVWVRACVFLVPEGETEQIRG